MKKILFFAIFACMAYSAVANSGSQGGVIGASKEKLMAGEDLTFEERSALLEYIQKLEQPVIVGTVNDALVVREGRVFKAPGVKLEPDTVITGRDALEALER